MDVLEWATGIMCLALVAVGCGWLFCDWRQQARRAQAAGRMAERYIQARTTSGRHHRWTTTMTLRQLRPYLCPFPNQRPLSGHEPPVSPVTH